MREKDEEVEGFKMTLSEHLEELRSRLIYSLSAVAILAILAYSFKGQVMGVLIWPYQKALQNTFGFGTLLPLSPDQLEKLLEAIKDSLSTQVCSDHPCYTPEQIEWLVSGWRRILSQGGGLIFTHPTEAFFGYLKLSLYAGLLVGMPFVLYQIWRFVMPALYRNERKYMLRALVFGSLLFYVGAAFCFMVILPIGLYFLIGVGQPYLTPLFTLNNYISFAMLLMLLFGLCFELPLAMYLVVKVGLVEHRTLVKQWRFAIVGAFALAALLTPTGDAFTMVALAGPLVVLYGVGLLLTRAASPQAEAEVAMEKGS